MSTQFKNPLYLIFVVCLLAGTLSANRLAASAPNTLNSSTDAITVTPTPSPTSPYAEVVSLPPAQIYVQGLDGEELLTIDRNTNTILSRTKVGHYPHPVDVITNTYNRSTTNSFGTVNLSAVYTKKVYVLVYDPILSNGQNLSTYLSWNSHATLTQGTIDFFKQASNNRLSYTVVYTTVVTDGWPEKIDGFRYTEAEYLAVINGQSPPHVPDGVDYTKIVNSPQFDICGKLNSGDIDEVWIYNGPGFGFYESTLVGPGAYWYNSPPVPGPTGCNKLLPIMGPSPERGLGEAVHNFGHRAEATMTQVYGSWQENRTLHNWDRFALDKAQSPDYSYSGCGNIHYPPNATQDYQYDNTSAVNSNCDDFANYPNLSDPLIVAQPITCSAWGCDGLGYYDYWFQHWPSFSGCAPDGFANDWWQYFANPALALTPSSPCQSQVFLPLILR